MNVYRGRSTVRHQIYAHHFTDPQSLRTNPQKIVSADLSLSTPEKQVLVFSFTFLPARTCASSPLITDAYHKQIFTLP